MPGCRSPTRPPFWKSYLFAFSPPSWRSLFGHSLFYPPLYGYLSGVAVALAGALGLVGPEHDLYAGLLVARVVSVVAGVGTVIVVGLAGARAHGRAVGLLAAALMASIPLEAMQTHYVSSDVLLGTTVALTFLGGCALTLDRRPLRAAACGACLGLAFATKYNAIVLGAVPAWVLLEVAASERSWRRVVGLAAAVAAGFAAALALACPPWLFETRRVVGQMQWINFMSTTANWLPANNHVTTAVGWYGRPYLYQLVASLPFGLGWPLALAALGGVGLAVARHTATDRVLLAGLAAYFFLVGRTNVSFARYLMPLFPALAVLAARALLALPIRRAAQAAIALAVVAYGFALGFSQVDRFSYDQQLGVARWIRQVFPQETYPEVRVVVPQQMAAYFQLREPLARVGIRQRTAAPQHWLDGRPEVFVLPEWYAISVRRDQARAAQRADLDRLESGTGGYVEAARWSTSYLQKGFYTWLDPRVRGGPVRGLDRLPDLPARRPGHARASAWRRSAMRSSGSSSPTESRIRLSLMPISSRSSVVELEEAHQRRLLDQRLDAAERRRDLRDLHRVDDARGGVEVALDLEAHDAAEAAHLAPRDVVPGVRRQAAVVHALDARVRGEHLGDAQRARVLVRDAQRQRLQAADQQVRGVRIEDAAEHALALAGSPRWSPAARRSRRP